MKRRNPYALEAKRTPQQVIQDKRLAKHSRSQRKRDAEQEARIERDGHD